MVWSFDHLSPEDSASRCKSKGRGMFITLCLEFVGTVSGMVTCRLMIRCWVLIYHFNPAKRTNNSSGVPTTPTPMPKSVQINFLKSIFNLNLKSSENSSFHTWCDSLIYRPDLRSYQTCSLTRILDA